MGSERDRALVFEAWRQYEDDSRVGAEAKARAVIAAVDAQHPAPALPRDVAMRVAEEVVRQTIGYGLPNIRISGELAEMVAAIVARHVPTDEEREAERAVVEAALAMHADIDEHGFATAEAHSAACIRLLAIRARRGAL